MNTFKQLFLLTGAFIFAVSTGLATPATDYDLPAAGGYDLVSYHQDTGPVRGSGYHTVEHEGVNYLFANEENKTAFEANPDAYLPAYNGFCAYGMALGKKFHTDPTIYEIVDDKLYLNLDKGIQAEWEKDIPGNIVKADENWASMQ